MTPTLPHPTALDHDAWHRGWHRAAARVMDELDRLRDDTDQHARDLSARCRRLRDTHANDDRPEFWTRTYQSAKRQADAAWTLARTRHEPLDPLGRPVDPTAAGRAAWERAWHLATGLTWTHPDDDDTPADHAAGLHYGDTTRRGHTGDLPACSACQDDELWTEQWQRRAAWLRNGRRTVTA